MTDVLRGPDVSAYQGVGIDWAAVKAAGASFAWAKCSEGVGYKDGAFGYNWPALRQAGLIRGSYHFARPALGNAPEAEADWFLQSVGTLLPGDLVALDLEEGATDPAAWGLAWLRHAERLLGWPPLLYTGLDYARSHFAGTPELAHFPLWLAAYGVQMPACPAPWRTYALWQHTANAHYSAIAGAVDESLAARSIDEIKALGKPSRAPQTAPASPHPVPAAKPPPHKVVIIKSMMLRRDPHHDDIYDPAQLVYRGATLDVVGPEVGGWLLVEAGARRGYVLKSNTRPA